MIDIFETISLLQVEKETKNIEPTGVLFEEILADVKKQVKEEIRELCREKKIEFRKTINSTSFNIIKNKSNEN